MKYIIDRFEGSLAVCEDEHSNFVNIDREKLPRTAVEGDVLVHQLNRYIIDENETKKRKENIQSLSKELWKE